MGYTVKRKILNLQFADPELQGLEVRARAVSLGTLMSVADQAEAAKQGAGLGTVREFLGLFCQALESWNAEDEDGIPVPATMEGLLDQEPDWALAVVLAWYDAMVSVPAPLGRRSTSGAQFPEVSIPMDVPSLNLSNLPMRDS